MKVKKRLPLITSKGQFFFRHIVQTDKALYIPCRLKRHRYLSLAQSMPFLVIALFFSLAFFASGRSNVFNGHEIFCNVSTCDISTYPSGSNHYGISGMRQARVRTTYAENDLEQPLYTIVLEHSHGEVILQPLPDDNSYWHKQWFVLEFNRKLKKAIQSPTNKTFLVGYSHPRLFLYEILVVVIFVMSIIAGYAYLKGLTQYTFDKNRGIFVVQQVRGFRIGEGGLGIKEGGFPLSEIVNVFTDEKYGRRVILERQSGKPFPILVQANYKPEELAELIRQFLANPPVEKA